MSIPRALLCAALLFASVPTLAHDEPAPIVVYNAWARPTQALITEAEMTAEPGQMEVTPEATVRHDHAMHGSGALTGAYMTIENRGDADARLIAVSSALAQAAEIHETTVENEIMRMNAIEAIAIPAGETAALEPGGYHLMLLDLVRDLFPGEAITLTLTFEIEGTDDPIDVLVGAQITDFPPLPGGVRAVEYPLETVADGSARVSLTLTTLGETDLELVGVLNEGVTLVDGDGAPLESVALPAGESVSVHLYIETFDVDLPVGAALPFTLVLSTGENLTIAVPMADDHAHDA